MIQVRLKQEVIELLKIPQYMAQLMIAIGSSEKNIKTWIRTNLDKITNYATLYAISKILEIPIEYLIDIECKRSLK
ncbi:hypothetical protein [Capnocytophaga catalasegens]|nr:hypothetical protein [Capnocytophaga catalasegens]